MNVIPVQTKFAPPRPAPNGFNQRAPIPPISTHSTSRPSHTATLAPLTFQMRKTSGSINQTRKVTVPIPALSPIAQRVSQAMESSPPIPASNGASSASGALSPSSARTIPSDPKSNLSQVSLELFPSTIEKQEAHAQDQEEEKEDDVERHRPSSVSLSPINHIGSDHDLQKKLQSLIEESVQHALFHPESGLHLYLEPMLRHTVRRALAEQMETSQYFSRISASDKLAWRLKALFTSRSFDDIVFERTRRYQVMEVFLLRRGTNQLVSYASNDPSRHCSVSRIQTDLKRLLKDCRDHLGQLIPVFDLPDDHHALVRKGQLTFLIAIMRGDHNPLVKTDLDYAILQIEQRFSDRLKKSPSDLLRPLQAILESCLLIQSPAPPKG